MTNETRKKISEASRKPIVQFSLNGFFIKEWYSITEAKISFNASIIPIKSNKDKIIHKTAVGFIWFRKSYFKNEIIPKNLNINILKKLTIRNKKNTERKIIQFSKNGDFIKKWNSIAEASNNLNISKSSIWNVCNKKMKHKKSAGGFMWRYNDGKAKSKIKPFKNNHIKEIIQYTLSGEFVQKFNSILNAEHITKIRSENIWSACSNKTKSAGGFMWRYNCNNNNNINPYQSKSKKVIK